MTAVAAMASYPDRFYAAASYVGFGGSPTSAAKGVASKFSNDAALLLYALYQQVLASPNRSILTPAVVQLIDAILFDPLVLIVHFRL